jgi:hypothetical protein
MAKKRYRPEEIIGKLREADVLISQGKKVIDVIKALGVTDLVPLAESITQEVSKKWGEGHPSFLCDQSKMV